MGHVTGVQYHRSVGPQRWLEILDMFAKDALASLTEFPPESSTTKRNPRRRAQRAARTGVRLSLKHQARLKRLGKQIPQETAAKAADRAARKQKLKGVVGKRRKKKIDKGKGKAVPPESEGAGDTEMHNGEHEGEGEDDADMEN
jgi:hypothetical protein